MTTNHETIEGLAAEDLRPGDMVEFHDDTWVAVAEVNTDDQADIGGELELEVVFERLDDHGDRVTEYYPPSHPFPPVRRPIG